MSTGTSPPQDINLHHTDIKAAPGVVLDAQQKTLVGSVLDLFSGRPSLKKLALWDDDATFEDPICIAKGRKQFAVQWYGLKAAFSQVEILSHEVTNPGNPMLVNMKNKYVVKGLGAEKIMESVVEIKTDEKGRISYLADKWSGSLPDGSIKNAFRRFNGENLPYVVSVPKNDEEDAKAGNQ